MEIERKFWYRWMLNYSFGELVSIGVAATIARFLFVGFSTTPSSSVLETTILISAGAAEGLIVGFMQWKSLSKLILHFKPFLWITITALATIASWLLILPPAILFISFLSKFLVVNDYYSILYSALVGIAFGGIVSISQFFVLRKFYKNAVIWIIANAIGWMLSFLIIYKSLWSLSATTSFIYNSIIIIISCILSGLVQGIVTGTALHLIMSVKKEFKRAPFYNHFSL